MFGIPRFVWLALLLLVTALGAQAERHYVRFENHCGFGTPKLIKGNQVLSSGSTYQSNGPLFGAIAYLQTGKCLYNGDGCTVVETTLRNPPSPGAGSSTDISLIPPLKYSVKTGFRYSNGCTGQGTTCAGASCPKAYRKPNDHFAQVNCQTNDVNLIITFC